LIKSLGHVGIVVNDLDKTVKWYVDNLGFSVGRKIQNMDRGTRMVFLEINGIECLEFFGFLDPKKALEGPTLKAEETGIKHISFAVDDVKTTCETLQTLGVEFTTLLPERATFKDLNGILIEIHPQRKT